MKRPPGIWLLLSAGVLWLSIQNVYGLKATALIFGKTTTTTTEVAPEGEHKDEASTATSAEENTIKSNLTGNPQLDYIYDPNLPRELNGYNLSAYPFFNSMPEDIDFKCDGLHDGFYASVPHKCQVYHHCLFGTRYDFLCANYTAFDQKTFICHFVSEVDCNNSHKYWHRNDALYQAASTTTVKPTPIVISPALTASPRRPAPAVRRRKPLRRRPQYEYYDDEYDDDREEEYEEPPPRRRRIRPRPRRPIYEDDYEEYEDDRYERRGSGRRNEEGSRKAYDNRETDERRGSDNDRKHDDRRNSSARRTDDERRPSDDRRIKDDDRQSHDTDDRRSGYDDRKPYDRREPDDRRSDDRKQYDRRESEDRRHEDRPIDNKRHKDDRRHDYDDRSRVNKDEEDFRQDRDRRKDTDRKKRPDDDYDDRRPILDKRPSSDRRYEKRRPADDLEPHERPRKGHRRPYDDDLYEDDREDDSRVYSRPRKSDSSDDPSDADGTPLVKPNSGSSVFNQPRMPPKIRPPVPKNEQSKFSFKPTTEKPASKRPEDDEEYYEYEDELPPKRTTSRPNRKPEPETSETRRPSKPSPSVERDERRDNRRPLGSASRPRAQMSRRPPADPFDDYEEEKPRSRPHTRPRHNLDSRDSKSNSNSRNRSPTDEDFSNTEKEDARTASPKHSVTNKERTSSQVSPKFIPKEQRGRPDVRDKLKTETTRSTTTTTTSTTTTTKEPPRQRLEPFVKVVKRPFLPSRGGNPYSARGLQPVGAKALDNSRNSSPIQEPELSISPADDRDNLEPTAPRGQHKHIPKPQPETSTSIVDEYDESKSNYKLTSKNGNNEQNNYKSTTENSGVMKNGRQFPTSTESKTSTFLINEQPVDNYKRKPLLPETPQKQLYETSYEAKEPEPPEEKPFKPSPIMTKVPITLKYSDPIDNEDEEEFHPVSNRPLPNLRQNGKPSTYQEPRTTEKPIIIEKNPLDITENEYDVTLNDALNPTIPNLPIRNFASGFNTATDYTFSTFHRPRYDVTLNQASENRYQVRAPSQRVETVAEPYVNRGENKYVTYNPQYNTAADEVYQHQNFRASPQITQAQTHAFYNVY